MSVAPHRPYPISVDEEEGGKPAHCAGGGAWLKGRPPHAVPRSACVFCPYRTNKEWLHLKQTDPDGWQRAVEIDHALRQEGTVANRRMQQKLYLRRSCVPLDVVDLGHEKTLFRPMTNECQGMCGV
jgi:hypothetical protein